MLPFVSFTANFLATCGKTTRVLSAESGKEKGENKGILCTGWCESQDGKDDVCVITKPDRVGDVCLALQEELYRHGIHAGKTQVWNAVGEQLEACDILERIAQAEDPRARVWKGSHIPTSEQGVRSGNPFGACGLC